MREVPVPLGGQVDSIPWTVRPEWLAGRYWWRVCIGGHPKVLVCHAEYGVEVAKLLAADEQLFRDEAGEAQA